MGNVDKNIVSTTYTGGGRSDDVINDWLRIEVPLVPNDQNFVSYHDISKMFELERYGVDARSYTTKSCPVTWTSDAHEIYIKYESDFFIHCSENLVENYSIQIEDESLAEDVEAKIHLIASQADVQKKRIL